MGLELELPIEVEEQAVAYAMERGTSLEKLFTSWLEEKLDASRDQAWYWSDGWQRAEKEAEADLQAGRYKDFDSMDALLADLMGE